VDNVPGIEGPCSKIRSLGGVGSICVPVMLAWIDTSNLSKAHVTCDSCSPATLAISVGLQQ